MMVVYIGHSHRCSCLAEYVNYVPTEEDQLVLSGIMLFVSLFLFVVVYVCILARKGCKRDILRDLMISLMALSGIMLLYQAIYPHIKDFLN